MPSGLRLLACIIHEIFERYSGGVILSLRGGEEAGKNGRRNANGRNRSIVCLIPCGFARSRRSSTRPFETALAILAWAVASAWHTTQASRHTAPI